LLLADASLTAGTPLLIAGVIIGAVLVLVAVCCGVWIGRKAAAPRPDLDSHTAKMVEALQGASQYTSGVAGEVSAHQANLRRISEQLADAEHSPTEPGHEDTGQLLREIATANESLQQKLDEAELALKQQAQEIEGWATEAHTDALTNLPNRRTFDSELAKLHAQWKRYDTPVSLMMLDIDHFKKFNDVHGHLAGDAVLKQVAEVLRGTMRETDVVTRFGGEEFAVILTNTEVEKAGAVAALMNNAIRDAVFEYAGKSLQVTVSCGVAEAFGDDTTETTIKRADDALYACKKAGRDCVHLHDGRSILRVPSGPARSAPASTSEANARHDSKYFSDNLRKKFLEVTGH